MSDPALRDPATLDKIAHAALKAGDVEGVYHAVSLMAVWAPEMAERWLATLRAGLALAAEQ